MRLVLPALLILSGSAVLLALPPGQAAPKRDPLARVWPTESDALAAALFDHRHLPPADQPFQRYVWVTSGDREDAKAVAIAANIISRASVIQRPFPIGAGKILLMRMDLRCYAPREADITEFIKTWEEFQFDPRFNLLITQDTLARLTFPDGEIPRVKRRVQKPVKKSVQKEVKSKGKTTFKTVVIEDGTQEVEENILVTDVGKTDLVRITGSHLDQRAFAELAECTQSQAPIVTSGYFVARALATIKNDKLFRALYGGLYYEFAGIKKKAAGAKGTDEDLFFEDHLGIGNVEAGLTAEAVYEKLRSDQRIATFRSDVTGKPRRVDFGRGLQSRNSQGSWAITHDPKDKDIDVGSHPILNLLKFKDAAREVIYDRPNGLHGYALFDGVGALQDEVPFDVANNHMIPSPHTKRLQAAIGCIMCHETEGSDGWKPLTNDVKTLRSSYVDILGDTSDPKRSIPDALDRLAGLYAGSPDTWLARGRDDYAAAVLRAAGPWEAAADSAQARVIRVAATKLSDIWVKHTYDMVDARLALRDLGFEVKKEDAPAVLRKLLPPEKSAAIGGNIPEDPRLAALFVGLSINRIDYDLCYAFAAARLQRVLQSKVKE